MKYIVLTIEKDFGEYENVSFTCKLKYFALTLLSYNVVGSVPVNKREYNLLVTYHQSEKVKTEKW